MTGELPLVSVAVITYNQLPLLRECVDSILAQDYPKIELVIADDASTDGTVAWLLEDLRFREGVHVVVKTAAANRGITGNSNAALTACSGKYIAWMGGDDLMLPGKIRKQVAYMEQHPGAAICFHDLDVFDSASGRSLYLFSDKNKPRTGGLRTAIRWGVFNGACSTMVRAECCPSAGFDERLPIASDWLFWTRVLRHGGTIEYIPEILGKYRRHGANATSADRRAPSVANIQDHLASCSTLLSEYPEYASEVSYRVAKLLLSLRFSHEGKKYRDYLIASLKSSVTPAAVGALLINILSGRKL